MNISVVIPAYNEEKRIGKTLSLVRDYFASSGMEYEVIVVDDGSDDGTVREAERSVLNAEKRLSVISNGVNRGKGFSVRSGMNATSGDFVLFSDADMSTPIEEVDKLFSEVKSGCDIAIGSRNASGSDVRVHQPWYRETMGKVFNLCVKTLLFDGINDTQCGFKLFRGDVARELAGSLKIEGFCFDVEMLYMAKKRGYKVKEVGVRWENSPQSKVKVIRSSASMFLDLFKIRSLHR